MLTLGTVDIVVFGVPRATDRSVQVTCGAMVEPGSVAYKAGILNSLTPVLLL